MSKSSRKGKGILADVKTQGHSAGDEVLLSWLKEPGNYTRFIKANGRNVKSGFIGCKPSMVFYKLNTWESKHVTAHLLARDGANEAVIRKAFPYYYDLVDVFDISATSDTFANQRRQQKQQQLSTPHHQSILLRLQRGRQNNKPMVASSSSSSSLSMVTTNSNRPSPVPQTSPATKRYNANVRNPPSSPLPSNATLSESSTTMVSDEGTIQRMLNMIEEQQQRHNEQIDRMFEMYQQQQSTTHQILNTQLKLSLISQYREIGMTKDEIVEQLRSGH